MKPQFNRTNAEIEWCRYTWNILIGCLHNCLYCYARPMAKRLYKEGFVPTFRPERLKAPFNTPKPRSPSIYNRSVFVSSMGDMWGAWVQRKHIVAVLDVVRQTPHWHYIFLTKNPARYLEFQFSTNCWLGATCTDQEQYDETVEVFSKMKNKPAVSFISFEPLLEKIECGDGLQHFQWIIIGAQSATLEVEEIQPNWNAVEKLLFAARRHKVAVYFKPNLKVRPREFPADNLIVQGIRVTHCVSMIPGSCICHQIDILGTLVHEIYGPSSPLQGEAISNMNKRHEEWSFFIEN